MSASDEPPGTRTRQVSRYGPSPDPFTLGRLEQLAEADRSTIKRVVVQIGPSASS